MQKQNFFNFSQTELAQLLKGMGKESFRAQQLFRWIYGQRIQDTELMTNLAKSFRQEVSNLFEFALPEILTNLQSQDGTRKLLFDVGQGKTVESVLIPSKGRLTLCVSSEIGCNMACKFCFTAKQKLQRKLTTTEIVGQFLRAQDLLPEGQRITNIVFMGMGEPLDNPEAVFRAIDILNDPWGINFSRRKITVSTSGLVPQIPLVTESGTRLAVSLNGVNDDVRSELMPINKRWPLSELLSACLKHTRESGDRVTFEYILIKGVTDSLQDARDLHKLTRFIPSKINIIPFNEHPGSGYLRPDEKVVDQFQQELIRLGAHVLRRKTMGRDIYAACGQLTSAYKEHPKTMPVASM